MQPNRPATVVPAFGSGTVAGPFMPRNPMSELPLTAKRQTGPALEATHVFLRWLIPAVEKFPRSQKFLLGDRIQSQALDVLEHLIDATYDRNRATALRNANTGIEKLRHLVRLACDLHHFDQRRYEYAARELDTIGRRIGAWRKADGLKADGRDGEAARPAV